MLLIPFGLSTVVLASISFLDDCYPISYRVRLFSFLAAIVFIKANLILTFPVFPYLEGSIFPQCFTVFVIISLLLMRLIFRRFKWVAIWMCYLKFNRDNTYGFLCGQFQDLSLVF